MELRVGDKHTVEVLLYLRRNDIEWYHSKPQHKEEFLDLLSEKILPRVFGHKEEEEEQARQDEMDNDQSSLRKKRKTKGKNTLEDVSTTLNDPRTRNKRLKMAILTKNKTAQRKRKSQSISSAQTKSKDDGTPVSRVERNIRHVFGEVLQLTYKTEPINRGADGITLYRDTESKDMRFREYPKLEQRIVAWCFRLDQDDPMAPDPSDGGFPKQDTVPLSELFRQPLGLSDDDDDDDDDGSASTDQPDWK